MFGAVTPVFHGQLWVGGVITVRSVVSFIFWLTCLGIFPPTCIGLTVWALYI